MLGGAAEGVQALRLVDLKENNVPPPQPPPQMLRVTGWPEPFAGSEHTKMHN